MAKDFLADFVTRMTIGLDNKRLFVKVECTPLIIKILHILYLEGCIKSYRVVDLGEVIVYLKYFRGYAVIRRLRIVSKRSNRLYWNMSRLLLNARRGAGFFILSTSLGLRSSSNISLYGPRSGGEVMLEVSL